MEKVEAAAIKTGGVVCFVPRPGRHHDVIGEMVKAGFPIPVTGQQGFITSAGRFVGREEARNIAAAQGQLIASEKDSTGVPFVRQHAHLFSEDVW